MKKIGLFFLGGVLSFSVQAQNVPPPSVPPTPTDEAQRKLFFTGGNLGLSFGDYTNINISPLIGYHLSDFIAAGINFNFNFVSDHTYSDGNTRNYTILGAGVFTRIYPLPQFYLQIQPEYNHYTAQLKSGSNVLAKETHDVPSLLMGLGYSEPIGAYSAFTLAILYDVLQNTYSPYFGRPVIQGGMDIGF
ncbi:MAG: hypothetical protein ACYCOO_03175 [Chitinophagaceae bacterium]